MLSLLVFIRKNGVEVNQNGRISIKSPHTHRHVIKWGIQRYLIDAQRSECGNRDYR